MSNGLKPGSIDEAIEADIDQYGLQHTLQRLELLCAEKSAHLTTNYSDTALALRWKLFEVKLRKLSRQAEELLP